MASLQDPRGALLQAGGGVALPQFRARRFRNPQGRQAPTEWLQSAIDPRDQQAWSFLIIPVAEFRDIVGAAVTATLSGADPATELRGARAVRPIWSAVRKRDLAASCWSASGEVSASPEQEWRQPSYCHSSFRPWSLCSAVIVFPWVFTIWMSLNEWKVGAPTTFVD